MFEKPEDTTPSAYDLEARALAEKISRITGIKIETAQDLLATGWTITFSLDAPIIWERPNNF